MILTKEELLRLREEQGLDHRDMAARIGVAVRYYGEVERGDKPLPKNWLDKKCWLLRNYTEVG